MAPEPVPPPWYIVSPSGVVHFVRDSASLDKLAEAGAPSRDDLRKLVGLRVERSMAKELPLHKQQWQLLQRVRYLQHEDTEEIVPVIGDTHHFVKQFASLRNDMRFDGHRLNQFLHGGWYYSNSKKVHQLTAKGCPHISWRLIEAPTNALQLLPHVCRVLLHLLRFQMEARSSLPLVQSFMERSRFRMGRHSSSVEAIKG